VDRVISTGHEPRRFVEDLLERLRDLILLSAAGSDGVRSLGEVPEDQLERMKDQTRRLGLARASQAGDLVNDALTHMIGATSPRLHLELLCARLVAAHGAGVVPAAGAPVAPAPAVGAGAPAAPPATSGGASGAEQARAAVAAARQEQVAAPAKAPQPVQAPEPVQSAPPVPQAPPAQLPPASQPAPSRPSAPEPAAEPAPVQSASPEPAPISAPATAADQTSVPPATREVAGGAEDAELIRRRWEEVLATLERRRVTWTMVKQSSQIASVETGVLTLAFDNAALAGRFSGSAHAENVALAVREALGLHVRVDAITDSGMTRPASASAAAPPAVATQAASSQTSAPRLSSPSPASAPSRGGSVASATSASGLSPSPVSASSAAGPPPDEAPPWDEEEDMSPDDAPAADAQLTGADVVAQMLGGTVVEE